jgi:putative spermidine/putrescine transport system ATP-binding protein
MADRVAVFDKGRIIQIGAPEDIYYRPNVPFVADFVGSSNVLPPRLMQEIAGIDAHGALRPEAVRLAETGHAATVRNVSFLGSATRVAMEVHGVPMTMLLPKGATIPAQGAEIVVTWSNDDLHVMAGA